MIHYASFKYDGENYLAVYVESHTGRFVRHGRTRWPSWHKFMHGGEISAYVEGSVSHIREIARRYGVISPCHREDILDDRWGPRFYANPFQPPNASPELLAWYEKRDQSVRIWRETGDDGLLIEFGLFPSRGELSEGMELE